MASSFSTDLKLELMVTGENAGTWGDKTNTNLNLVQQAIAGFQSISIAGGPQTTALTMDNAALSNARNAVVKLTGTITGNQIVTVPTGIEKTYIVQNGTSGAFTVEFKQSGGTGTTFSATDKSIKIVFADGTNINTVDLDTLSGEIATAQLENLAVTSGKLASFAVTSARLASFAVTTARLATNAVTAIKITQSTITQAKLAANSVGSNQLISTGVTAATYTAATITVDADGRITSASSGSGGAGMGIPTLYSVGPTSGTFTATPSANRLAIYMVGGGGNAGGNISSMGDVATGAPGGYGGHGFYDKPITQPFSQPFSVGGPGGNTTLTDVGTVNAGNAGGGGSFNQPVNPGNPGNAPGASLNYPTVATNFVVGGNIGKPGFNSTGFSAPGEFTSVVAGALVIFENTGT